MLYLIWAIILANFKKLGIPNFDKLGIPKLLLDIYEHARCDLWLNEATIFATIINFVIMLPYRFKICKIKILSLILYSFTCFILGNIWYWTSIVPGLYVFCAVGGLLI